jgi:hypothetical protein
MIVRGALRLFLVLCFLGATAVYTSAQAPAASDSERDVVDDLLTETQKSVTANQRIGIVWWIPAEFWEASTMRQGTSQERAHEMFASLREYTIVCVAVGKMGVGNINWYPEGDLRANTILRDSAGLNYKPITEISSDAGGLLSVMKPVLANILGPMGQSLQFLMFPAKTQAGSFIADPRRAGNFSVVISDLLGPKESSFDWRLPLTSLSPPRFCPVGHERVKADWKYCPWHGVALPDAAAPAIPPPQPKKEEKLH